MKHVMNDSFLIFFIAFIILLPISLIFIPKKPNTQTLQIDYIKDSVEYHTFLNVIKVNNDHFEVYEQEYNDTICPITITRIFNYENIK